MGGLVKAPRIMEKHGSAPTAPPLVRMNLPHPHWTASPHLSSDQVPQPPVNQICWRLWETGRYF